MKSAECFVNNESLSSYLVQSGYAFAYRKYSKKFIKDENYVLRLPIDVVGKFVNNEDRIYAFAKAEFDKREKMYV